MKTFPSESFRISASQLTLYGLCPRKYYYQYVLGLPRPEQPSGLAFGGAIHAAIEWAEAQRSVGVDVDPKDVIRIFRADLEAQAQGNPPLIFQNGETLEDLVKLGAGLLPLALRELGKTMPVSVEDPFEVKISGEELDDGTPIHLVGVIDRLEEGGTIVELKTAKRRYSKADVAQNLQLTSYVLAQHLRSRGLPSVRLLALLKTTRPEAVWYETRRSPDELRWFSRVIGETTRAIDRGVFPPRISWACTDCEHRLRCKQEGVVKREARRVGRFAGNGALLHP